jgi:hypothetical protein
MTLTSLIEQSSKIGVSIKFADERFDNLKLRQLHAKRDALNLTASHVRPANSSEIAFLCDLIKEYADFVADAPVSPLGRDEALEAIVRMATNLKTPPSCD